MNLSPFTRTKLDYTELDWCGVYTRALNLVDIFTVNYYKCDACSTHIRMWIKLHNLGHKPS